MKKTAFTFVEVILAIVVTSLIVSSSLNVVNTIYDGGLDKLYTRAFFLFKKASGEILAKNMVITGPEKYCDAIEALMNVSSDSAAVGCAANSTIPDSPNLVLVNGMYIYGIKEDISEGPMTISVDVNGPKRGQNADGKDIFKIVVYSDGRVEPYARDAEKNTLKTDLILNFYTVAQKTAVATALGLSEATLDAACPNGANAYCEVKKGITYKQAETYITELGANASTYIRVRAPKGLKK